MTSSIRTVLVAACAVFFFACSHSEVQKKEITFAEKKRIEARVGDRLSMQLESKIKIRPRDDLTEYLDQMSERLVAAHDKRLRKDSPLSDQSFKPRVALVEKPDPAYRNYAFLGDRLYLSAELIRQVQYENELAAMLAFELSKLRTEAVKKQLEELDQASGKPFDERQILDQDELKEVAGLSVAFMYETGYDARGFMNYLSILEKNPSRSTFSQSEIQILKRTVQHEISLRTPLRNPIVRSDGFVRYRERIRKL